MNYKINLEFNGWNNDWAARWTIGKSTECLSTDIELIEYRILSFYMWHSLKEGYSHIQINFFFFVDPLKCLEPTHFWIFSMMPIFTAIITI